MGEDFVVEEGGAFDNGEFSWVMVVAHIFLRYDWSNERGIPGRLGLLRLSFWTDYLPRAIKDKAMMAV